MLKTDLLFSQQVSLDSVEIICTISVLYNQRVQSASQYSTVVSALPGPHVQHKFNTNNFN